MKPEFRDFHDVAVTTARGVGALLRRGFGAVKRADMIAHHDIKLEMDVRAQEYIYRRISRAFPDHAFLGEEDTAFHGGRKAATETPEYRWIVDPLDGTVNYFYRIPHYCTSIACQKRKIRNPPYLRKVRRGGKSEIRNSDWETIVGVIYDPSRDELFSAQRGEPALLNGKPIRVSSRTRISDAIMSIGLFKSPKTIRYGTTSFARFGRRARKIRIMGAAALDLAYVACGRYDAYLEYGIKIWDIAAGVFILERAGGSCRLSPSELPNSFECVATNGKILKNYRLTHTAR